MGWGGGRTYIIDPNLLYKPTSAALQCESFDKVLDRCHELLDSVTMDRPEYHRRCVNLLVGDWEELDGLAEELSEASGHKVSISMLLRLGARRILKDHGKA